jgi:hypothetical protein
MTVVFVRTPNSLTTPLPFVSIQHHTYLTISYGDQRLGPGFRPDHEVEVPPCEGSAKGDAKSASLENRIDQRMPPEQRHLLPSPFRQKQDGENPAATPGPGRLQWPGSGRSAFNRKGCISALNHARLGVFFV